MKPLIVSLSLWSLSGCGKDIYAYNDPPDSVYASTCGVSEADFKKAKALALEQPTYANNRVGNCDLTRVTNSYVVVITLEDQRRVEAMLAREAAEKKK